jgi:hypothetical protein
VIPLEANLIESSIPPAASWPAGNPFNRAWAFARESGRLLARHPGLLVFSFFDPFWTTAIWINDVTSTTSYSVDAEYGPTWTEAGLSLLASHASNSIPAITTLGLLAATLTVQRGGGLGIWVALSVAGRNLRPIVALVVAYFLTNVLYFVVMVWASPSGNALLHGVFLIVFVSFAAITLFALVHIADRGGGLFSAVRTSFCLVRAAAPDAAKVLVVYAILLFGSLVWFTRAASLPPVDKSLLFGEFGARLLYIGLSVPVHTLITIYLCQLYWFARGREMERAAVASA